jgi:hypothetical protein
VKVVANAEHRLSWARSLISFDNCYSP